MVTNKTTEVVLVENNRGKGHDGGYDPMFKIEHHGIKANRSEQTSKYILDFAFKLMNEKEFILMDIVCKGEYTINKNLCSLNVGDLYSCIIIANNEISKFIEKDRLLDGATPVPPQRQMFLEVLQELLQQLDCPEQKVP